jgi:hypothetical protein
MQGSALQGTMTGGALPVELTAEVPGNADRDMVGSLIQEAVAASPVSGLLRGVHESLFTLTLNGAEIETQRVRAIGRAAEADPAEPFEHARPAAGDWHGLVARVGTTPETEEATSSSGSSYQEHQSRRLLSAASAACARMASGRSSSISTIRSARSSAFSAKRVRRMAAKGGRPMR